MKKLFAVAILARLVAAPIAPGNTVPADAHCVDLVAGQNEVIGQVCVWVAADELKVYFDTPETLLETHVHVATQLGDIPQTKKGNPIPGQFASSKYYPDEHLHTFSEVFPRCDGVYIAAHAAMGVSETLWVFSDGGESFTAYSGPGTGNPDCPCEDVFSPRGGSAVEAWQHSAWISNVNPHFTYGTWIWEADRSVNPICGDIVDFTEGFNIPGYPDTGTLWVTADNGYEAYLNGTSLGSDGVQPGWRTNQLKESHVTTAQSAWSSVEDYDLADYLQQGANTFLFETANEHFCTDDGHSSPGTVDSNPGGLIYEAEIQYWASGETAWAGDQDFLGANWATYFMYTRVCPEPLVVNGDFEAPVVNTSQRWDIYDSGTSGLGWTIEWAGTYTEVPTPAHLELHGGVNGWLSYGGSAQHAELDTDWGGPGHSQSGEPASVRIYQDICTCPGKNYTLSYAWSPRPGPADNILEVYWDGSPLLPTPHSGAGGTNTSWILETHTGLEVTGYITRLEFREAGTADSLGMFLDAVSVTLEE